MYGFRASLPKNRFQPLRTFTPSGVSRQREQTRGNYTPLFLYVNPFFEKICKKFARLVFGRF